jgi:hypothetical protein
VDSLQQRIHSDCKIATVVPDQGIVGVKTARNAFERAECLDVHAVKMWLRPLAHACILQSE